MIYATPATGLAGLFVLLLLILGGVRIGSALGLVGIGGLALVLSPEAAVIKVGVITIDTLTRYELGTLPLFLLMAHVFFSVDASRDMHRCRARGPARE